MSPMRRFLRSVRLLMRDLNRAQATARGRRPCLRDGIGTVRLRQVLSTADRSPDGGHDAAFVGGVDAWPTIRTGGQGRYPPVHLSTGQPRGGE